MSSVRCHTVPQFYLKYFLQSDLGLFWVYDKKDSSFKEQSPFNTSVIGDYYLSSPDKEGNKDQRMERFFAVLEAIVKPIFDRWISNPANWQEDDKHLIAMFLSFMHTRVPRTIDMAKEIGAAGIDCCLGDLKEVAKDEDKSRKLYDEFCASEEGKDCKVSFDEYFQLISDPLKYASVNFNEKYAIGESLLLSEEIYHILMKMYWGIGYIDGKQFFITSDAPINIFVPTSGNKAIFGGGIKQPKAEVTFSLSPKLCLRIKHIPIKKYYRVYADFVDEINRRNIYAAERYAISPFKSNRIHKIVKEFAGIYGKPKINIDFIKQRFKEDQG